jgi:hypothetical protein
VPAETLPLPHPRSFPVSPRRATAMQFKTGDDLQRHTFTIDGRGLMRMLSYTGPMGQRFSVPLGSIVTVSLAPQGPDAVQFVVVGAGAELAHVPMARPYAEAAQAWVLGELAKRAE